MEPQRIWVIWADNHPDHPAQCLRDGQIIIGWDVAGDLHAAVDVDDIRAAVRQRWPTAGSVFYKRPGYAVSQLSRFTLEMAEGDFVAMLTHTRKGLVSVGKVNGPYRYRAVAGGDRHTRPVQWLKIDAPRGQIGSSPRVYRRTVNLAYPVDMDRITDLIPAWPK